MTFIPIGQNSVYPPLKMFLILEKFFTLYQSFLLYFQIRSSPWPANQEYYPPFEVVKRYPVKSYEHKEQPEKPITLNSTTSSTNNEFQESRLLKHIRIEPLELHSKRKNILNWFVLNPPYCRIKHSCIVVGAFDSVKINTSLLSFLQFFPGLEVHRR